MKHAFRGLFAGTSNWVPHVAQMSKSSRPTMFFDTIPEPRGSNHCCYMCWREKGDVVCFLRTWGQMLKTQLNIFTMFLREPWMQ